MQFTLSIKPRFPKRWKALNSKALQKAIHNSGVSLNKQRSPTWILFVTCPSARRFFSDNLHQFSMMINPRGRQVLHKESSLKQNFQIAVNCMPSFVNVIHSAKEKIPKRFCCVFVPQHLQGLKRPSGCPVIRLRCSIIGKCKSNGLAPPVGTVVRVTQG